MVCIRFLLPVIFAFAGPVVAAADGLVTQLPGESAWATFRLTDTTMSIGGEEKNTDGTLTIKRLGDETVDGNICCWIEIELKYTWPDNPKAESHSTIWKLLIQQSSFEDEEGPIDGIVRGYVAHGYESQKLRPEIMEHVPQANVLRIYLHNDWIMPRELPERTIRTDHAELSCMGFNAETTLYDSDDAQTEIRTTTFTQWTNDQTPFGVVELSFDRRVSGGLSTRQTLTLSSWGDDAESRFPDAE